LLIIADRYEKPFCRKGGEETMKRHLLAIMVVFGLLVFASTGWAVPLSEVGGLDTLYDSALLANSGYPTELAWIQLVLGPGYTFAEEDIYDSSGAAWEAVDNTNYWALNLDGTPEYFYIKIGTGSLPPGTPDHYLYINNPEYDWAVVDLSDFGDAANIDVFRISHIGEVGTTQTPEPASILLLGIGMVGLAGFRRKFA